MTRSTGWRGRRRCRGGRGQVPRAWVTQGNGVELHRGRGSRCQARPSLACFFDSCACLCYQGSSTVTVVNPVATHASAVLQPATSFRRPHQSVPLCTADVGPCFHSVLCSRVTQCTAPRQPHPFPVGETPTVRVTIYSYTTLGKRLPAAVACSLYQLHAVYPQSLLSSNAHMRSPMLHWVSSNSRPSHASARQCS